MISFLVSEIITFTSHPFSDFALPANILRALIYGQFLPKQATKDRTATVRTTYSRSKPIWGWSDGVMEGMVNTSSKMHKAFEYEGIMHTTKLGPALLVHLQAFCSHCAFEEPRGTSTVRNEPGVRDITTCSVTP